MHNLSRVNCVSVTQFSYKRLVNLSRGRAVSGNRDHINRPLVFSFGGLPWTTGTYSWDLFEAVRHGRCEKEKMSKKRAKNSVHLFGYFCQCKDYLL